MALASYYVYENSQVSLVFQMVQREIQRVC
ncbi:hypothetical protein F383_31136 [Gossypium arboreum]|uniref:Uncharacterized protein n=1 Tax=Gossypium arboreum TaxID=29729 RepID=A0A0B0MXH9_GOSAR|nr:hypothetical protein F383_31136 [Gossypium arboreum]